MSGKMPSASYFNRTCRFVPFISGKYQDNTCFKRAFSIGPFSVCLLEKVSTSYNRSYMLADYIVQPDRFHCVRLYSVRKKADYTNLGSSKSLSFPDMMRQKQQQAQNSLLIEIPSKNDLSYATDVCKDYGEIKKAISFSGKYIKEQVLVEFSQQISVHRMLSNCGIKDPSNVYPVHSRCLKLYRKGNKKFKGTSNEEVEIFKECNDENYSGSTVSEMMVQLYVKQKMSDLSTRLRFLSCVMMQDVLYGIFPQCTVFPFGSSVNGFGKCSSDLDTVLRLYPQKTKPNAEFFFQTKINRGIDRDLQRNSVFAVGQILQSFIPGVFRVQKILNARVPIVKFTNYILGLECDLSVNNMPATHMSEILYLCGEIDSRVRPLVYAVKMWAKEAGITYEVAGAWITNFSITLLVIYFLQNRPTPVLPTLSKLIKLPDNVDNHLECIKYIHKNNEILMSCSAQYNTESLAILLKEFLKFLASFPFENRRICLLSGEANQRNNKEHAIWINYPLISDQNVTKNVSRHELEHLRQLASVTLKNLEKNSQCILENADLLFILGIEKKYQENPSEIDVQNFFDRPSGLDQACAIPSAVS